ncbi:MAG: lysostaphin resistance A-like protein [Candidatus Limnocylindria bacterium]
MDDRPAWDAPPPEPAAPDEATRLQRYRPLQALSLLLILGGGLAAGTVVALGLEDLAADRPAIPPATAAAMLIALLLGGLALVVGLVMNAVRAVIVREVLPAGRYRGPSIVVLLLLALIVSTFGSVAAAQELAAIQGDGRPTVPGSLLLLTITQISLLAVAAVFVLMPRALAGIRLLPDRGLRRSVLLGLGLALPAWVGAQLLGYLVVSLLDRMGLEPEPGIAEAAIQRVDPAVLVLALVLVAPVAEEIFFRGVVYNAWEREYGSRRALYGSAVLFGLIHAPIFVFVPIAVGLVLALVYRSTRSLPAAIALHAGFNAISVAIGLLARYDVIRLPVT